MSHRTFHYDGATVGVESEDAGTLGWLEEFLSPSFEVGSGRTPTHRVRYVVDAAESAALERAAAAAPVRPMPCFALDTHVVVLPGRLEEGGAVLRDETYGCFYRVADCDVEIVADPRAPGRRLPLLRVVREVAAEVHRRSPGRLQLHAAAVAVGEDAVLLAGPKNAGKTTLLVHALAEPGARFLGNDRVFVTSRRDVVVARGMPTVVSVRRGTLERFPDLLRALPDVPHPSHMTLDEARRALGERGRHPVSERVRMTPAQLCRGTGARALSEARLAAVLLCEVDLGVAGRRVEGLGRAEAIEGLARCRYGVASSPVGRTVFDTLVGDDSASEDAASLAALADRVPVFRCRLGRGAYDVAGGFSALLGEVVEKTT